MAKASTGVITAMPAIEPVDRKNSAMPRRRVNHWLITGVTATGLVNARPIDSSTPKARPKLQASRASTVHTTETATIAVPSSSTTRVPKRATRWPASGIARP